MSLTLGICTSTEGSDNPKDLDDLGAEVARFVLTAQAPWLPMWHEQDHRAVHGVVGAETFTGFGLDPHKDFRLCAEKVQQTWGSVLDYLEIGNEPDDSGGSSYAQSAFEFAVMQDAFCFVFHQNQHQSPVLISGGLNSGQPSYLAGYPLSPCMLLGLHDYDSRLRGWPSATFGHHDLDGYLAAYKPIYSRMAGVAITEWGHTSQDDAWGAEYIRRWVAIVREHPEVKLAEWFSLSDAQHFPHGLVRSDGKRKAAFDVYAEEIRRGTGMATVEERLKQLETQQALQTGALKAIGQLLWKPGAESLEGQLIALTGDGNLKVKDFPKA